MKTCKNCEKTIPEDSQFCPFCGNILEPEQEAELPAGTGNTAFSISGKRGLPASDVKSGGKRNPHRYVILSAVLLVPIVILVLVFYLNTRKPFKAAEMQELNLYTWNGYISEGLNGTFDTLSEFGRWYEKEFGTPVHINQYYYSSNEEMFENVTKGTVQYDIVIPTDYMVSVMAAENYLLPINYANIPNYRNIREDFKGLYFDSDNKYSVPYIDTTTAPHRTGPEIARSTGASCLPE